VDRFRAGLKFSAEPPKLRFGAYLRDAILPQIPALFGHYDLFPKTGWGMLGNATYGNCFWAGAAHLEMLWNMIAGHPVKISTLDTLDDYASTGFVTSDPTTDNGTDLQAGAAYWKTTGIRDMNVDRHKIVAYVGIDVTRFDHIDAAAYLFDGVGLGVQLTSNSEIQFEDRKAWTLQPNDAPSDYHFVPYVGRDATYRKAVTWGALQDIGDDWFKANVKEAVAFISEESLINGKSAEGFDLVALQSDLQELTA
jgi:hypothetical protein